MPSWLTALIPWLMRAVTLFGLYLKGRSDVKKDVKINTLEHENEMSKKAMAASDSVRLSTDAALIDSVYEPAVDEPSKDGKK